MPEIVTTETLIAAAESKSADSHSAPHAVDSHGEAHSAVDHAVDAAHDAHADAHGSEDHGAHHELHYPRHTTHPPELPHFIQIWFEVEKKETVKKGQDPYGNPESPEGISLVQGLHVGYMSKPAPLVGYAPWENNVFGIIAALILIGICYVGTASFRGRSKQDLIRKPTRLQTITEIIVLMFDDLCKGVLGEKNGRRFLPFVGAMFLIVLTFNFMGLIPFMKAPSSYVLITFSLSLCTFLTYQWIAWTNLGPKNYFLHLCGYPKSPAQWILAPLMFILEVTSDFVAKPLSLALRLFGNVLGKDILLGVMLILGLLLSSSTLPAIGKYVGVPLTFPFIFLALMLSAIQALVFALLSSIYILLVLPHDDDHGHEEHH